MNEIETPVSYTTHTLKYRYKCKCGNTVERFVKKRKGQRVKCFNCKHMERNEYARLKAAKKKK